MHEGSERPSQQDDASFMARALQLAQLGLYTTMPNPRVGCVLVKGGQIVGEGHTSPIGGPHAEACALAVAGSRARDCTAYVTMEPCSHQGLTPPCALALADAGVSRVLVATRDPNPQVDGHGLALLEQAGIEVSCGLMAAEARKLNAGFFKRMTAGLPWTRCKLAMSLDGRTAMASGASRWITGPEARADVQLWRARSCAIVTGVDSVICDNPLLNLRPQQMPIPQPERAAARQPLRVIVDSHLRTPPTAALLAGPGQTLVACVEAPAARARPLEQAGAHVLVLPDIEGQVDLVALMQELARRQCNEVMVEAGARLAGAVLTAGLVDELVIYMAPTLMGSDARPLMQLPLTDMDQKKDLVIEEITACGPDWRILAHPAS
ncbi:MAG: bifunctional diaminohydroxyphosphoribosylaminopyrimidine deaminase/5-amino-6-(5-phosphoribosylamino)uracil reductase RibD [Kistimonas sp.]|nr:bifunctional diaminohydroxyphosphoribosylaminopyrimidine deaminase/5-amino-6-(5-phosphoribosylamino)uracil reductase RibD [Kistimonas sp.]